MGRLRPLSGKQVCAILGRHGFVEVRRRGSHVVMQKQLPETTITVPVPDHSNSASAPCNRSSASQASREKRSSKVERREPVQDSRTMIQPRQAGGTIPAARLSSLRPHPRNQAGAGDRVFGTKNVRLSGITPVLRGRNRCDSITYLDPTRASA
ncbi:type II toxin-antitoxin system HicA family toxin [Thioalkalivibrio sp.]|uniref:type II toxin-antitoxin system HicA family toxin n=1 Tax=Thioalkalivibrio sp. TaxID=2093813 RepID=UPI0035686AAA